MWSIQFQKVEEKAGLQKLRSLEEPQNGLQMKSSEQCNDNTVSEEEENDKSDPNDDIDSNQGNSVNLSGSYVFVSHQDAKDGDHHSAGSFDHCFC